MRKHLIFTGKNGSGKTTTLKEINTLLNKLISNSFANIENVKNAIISHEKPIFDILTPSDKATQTKELLEKCFNGEHTGQKLLESSNLRSLLLKEIRIFQELLFEHEENPDDVYLVKIKYHLNNHLAFTAFKRWIIKDNNYLKKEFEQYIED